MKGKRLTASAVFHGYRINRDYCGNINDDKTNCVRFFKKSLPFYQLYGKFLTYCQKLCILVIRQLPIGIRRFLYE